MTVWRNIQKTNIRSFSELVSLLQLSEKSQSLLDPQPHFVLNLPRRLALKIAKDDPTDPLFRQFVPLMEEKHTKAGFVADPVSDLLFTKNRHLLQKYASRALLLTTGACAMNCRFCFRQNYPYDTAEKDFSQDIAHIKADTSIEEIILSGGDPLSLSDNTLNDLLQALDPIAHVKRIRFHSRFPIGIPERIDDTHIDVLSRSSKQIWFALHTNHPNEFDSDVWAALRRLQKCGITLISQSVLLRGVNDDIVTLETLCRELVNHGVLPYYLHQLDKVSGAGHFEVPIERGKELIDALRTRLSGYAVPKYVQEIAGMPSKTALTSEKLSSIPKE